MNSVLIIGNVTRDLELKTTQTGKSVCNFDVAVARRFNREETDFFRVTVWEKQAENCAEYLRKGSKVGVRGEMHSREYEQDGEKRLVWGVRADEVEFLSPRDSNTTGTKETARKGIRDNPPIDDDNLPF